MKTMKMIDLLVKIANREEVPEAIIYNGETYQKCRSLNGMCFYENLENSIYLLESILTSFDLLREVEIIKEDKKIEKISLPSFDEFKKMSAEERYTVTAIEYDLLNNIIDKINDLKEND